MKRYARILLPGADGRLLICVHRDGNVWNFPGGKVARGESPHEAAFRELAEETGISLQTLRLLHTGTYTFGSERWHGTYFLGAAGEHAPSNLEPTKFTSVGFEAVNAIRQNAGGRHLLDALDAYLRVATPTGRP